MAQFGSVPALGAGGRRFKSSHPDFFLEKFFEMGNMENLRVSWRFLEKTLKIIENLGEFLKSFISENIFAL